METLIGWPKGQDAVAVLDAILRRDTVALVKCTDGLTTGAHWYGFLSFLVDKCAVAARLVEPVRDGDVLDAAFVFIGEEPRMGRAVERLYRAALTDDALTVSREIIQIIKGTIADGNASRMAEVITLLGAMLRQSADQFRDRLAPFFRDKT